MNTIEETISYTLTEAARFLKVSVYELRSYIKHNRIEALNTGWSQRILGKELKRYVENLRMRV